MAAYVLLQLTLVYPATTAFAQTRRRFEPTDLQLQPVGTLEVDAQLSYIEGDTAGRIVVPDLEVSLGLARNIELEIDTAYAIEGRPMTRFTLDHPAPDNLWFSSKMGLLDLRSESADRSWAFGLQQGPKLPLAPGARGVGYEALFLGGVVTGPTHVFLNLGGFVDPNGDPGAKRRPVALEAGLDLAVDLDKKGIWSLLFEAGAVEFLSGEARQAHLTAGAQWGATPNLDLSLAGMVGLFPGSDRGGILVGVTPRFALWK